MGEAKRRRNGSFSRRNGFWSDRSALDALDPTMQKRVGQLLRGLMEAWKEKHGLSSLVREIEMPRGAAIAHEVGHMVVGPHDDVPCSAVRVWHESRDEDNRILQTVGMRLPPCWGGMVDTPAWRFDDHGGAYDTMGQPTLRGGIVIASVQIAGWAAEQTLGPREDRRKFSSYDEVLLSQLLSNYLSVIASKEGAFGWWQSPEKVFDMILSRTYAILECNTAPASEMIAYLDRHEMISGEPLNAIARKMRRLPDDIYTWQQTLEAAA